MIPASPQVTPPFLTLPRPWVVARVQDATGRPHIGDRAWEAKVPAMLAKARRLAAGFALTLRGFAREPRAAADVLRWLRDASARKDPLRHRRPWWNYRAMTFVEQRLPERAEVFEYGGGASTLWLRDRGAKVITVEDDQTWHSSLSRLLPDADLRLIPRSPRDTPTPDGPFRAYSQAIIGERDDSFDLVIVDGQARRDCIVAAAAKVKPGGMLLLDDSQWSDTRPPPRRDRQKLREGYADLPAMLSGWPMHHLRGIKPGTWLPVQTTVWIKPVRS